MSTTQEKIDLSGFTGYERRYLPEHLELGGLRAELEWLLLETPDGQNAWFQIKERHGEIDYFQQDVARAARLAAAGAPGLEVRHTLAAASSSGWALDAGSADNDAPPGFCESWFSVHLHSDHREAV